VVAKVMVEICHSQKRHDVYHVVNPKSFNWTRDLLPMLHGAGLKFERVSAQDWLKLLAASNPDPALNPTIKLLDFFKTKYATPKTGPGVFFETKTTEGVSETLRNIGAPDAALIGKMVEYWTSEAGSSDAAPTAASESGCSPVAPRCRCARLQPVSASCPARCSRRAAASRISCG